MRAAVLPILVMVPACSQIDSWRHPELAVCDDYVKSTLRSPATYMRAKATISDSRLPAAYWQEKAETYPKAMQDTLKEVSAEYQKKGGRRIVILEYDASNAYGTPVRGLGSCKFEMQAAESNEFFREPSATMAKADAALAAAGIGEQAEGCCESRDTLARMEKYEPQAEYVSQKVFD